MTVVIGLMTLVGGALAPGIASAQDSGDATITVEQIHPTGTGAHYFVRVSGADESATVTATPTSPDGKAGDPVTLTTGGEPDLFQGAVDMPDNGTWTVTFTSKGPDATLDYSQKVPAETLTADGASSSGDSGSDDPSPVGPLIFAGLFVLALVAMGVWALIERGKSPAGQEPSEPTDDDAGTDDDASVSASTE
jgi:hypothetical protein